MSEGLWRDVLYNLKAKGMQPMPCSLGRGEQSQFGQTEFSQNLAARTRVASVDGDGPCAGTTVSSEVWAVRVITARAPDLVQKL